MKTKFLIALAAVGLILPGVASADPTRAEVRQDVRAVHHEHHELVRARHHQNWHKARHERRELRRAKHRLHHDRREWRNDHRN